ncbi:MAG: ABC transporter permease, partial [Alphaproteobacteria bacterium]|nr:ABC transporter permease [Alphaproteobacteria bacterium]
MTVFIIRRLMQSSVVVAVMSLLVFVGVNIVGDPVDMLINPEADQAEIERVMRDLGLDR